MKKLLPVILALLTFSAHAEDEEKKVTGPIVVIKTNMGTMKAMLHEDTAPKTVANFLTYTDDKFFDGTVFHRIINGFMIQGGGFELTEDEVIKQKKPNDPIINESAKGRKNKLGTLAMARTGDPNSATSQFFINVKDNAALDYPNNGGGYAVFGHLTEGLDVLNKIKAVKTHTTSTVNLGPGDRYAVTQSQNVPVETVKIISIRRAEKKQ